MSASTQFRPEIQGLRGIAALLVAAYHIWFARVSGGVDVFFVVSGFLITHSLLNRLAADGRVRPAQFLWDLYCRLGPPAVLVVALTAVGSRLFLPHSDWPFNISEAVSAAFFVNNWHLALNAVDYLNRTSDPRPFQHFWALSVQWQFYLLWSLVFLLVHRAARTDFRRVLAGTVAGLFVVSLAVSVIQTAHNQPFAYFNTAARIWEFAAGALLAMFQTRWRVPQALSVVFGWSGLAAIILCGAILPVATSFPGFAALLPVGGAILILAHGSGGHPASVRRFLSWKPLVAFGGVSYYFYLWHWPLVVLWLSYTLQSRASVAGGLGIMALALSLSIATHALMRVGSTAPQRAWPGRSAVALTALTVWMCLLWRAETREAMSAQMAMPAPPASTHPGAMSIGREVADEPPFPGAFRIRSEFPVAYRQGCSQTTLGTEVIVCSYGDAGGRVTIAAIGNSHITHWLPALDLAGREHGWRILLIAKDDCRLRVRPAQSSDEAAASCDAWNARLPAVVRRLAPDFLFVGATVHDGDRETVPRESLEAWRRLMPRTARVIAVRGTPRFPFDVPDCVDLHGADSPKCRVPAEIALGRPDADLRAAVERAGAEFLDLTEYFCRGAECYPVIGNIVIYRDHDHLTPAYVATLKEPLAHALEASLRRGLAMADTSGDSAPAAARLACLQGAPCRSASSPTRSSTRSPPARSSSARPRWPRS